MSVAIREAIDAMDMVLGDHESLTLAAAFIDLLEGMPFGSRVLINGPTAAGAFTVSVTVPLRHRGKIAGGTGNLVDAILKCRQELEEVVNG